MTEELLETLQEAYYAAVHHLVTGGDGLRQRLRAAVAELEKCKAFCNAKAKDEYEAAAVKALPGLLEEGRKIAGLSQRQCEDMAWGIWAAHQEEGDALTRRARLELDGMQE